MKKTMAMLTLLLLAPLVQAQFKEGVHYEVLSNPQPTADAGKIEVLELFWYGCPHCYHLEPELNAWLEKKPDDVNFVRMPAVLGPSWELHARAYYTAELLGVLDKVHTPLFESLHKARQRHRKQEDIKAFFLEQGVSAEDFDNTFNSFAVITKTNRAKQVRNLYGITGVPMLVVNGKYRTGAQQAGSNSAMLQVVDELVERERQAMQGSAAEPAAAQ